MTEHEHLEGGHIGIEPMCKHCGYVGIEKRVDIPGAMEKVLFLQRIGYILFALIIPSLLLVLGIVVGKVSSYWLVMVVLHGAAIYWVTRTFNQIETAKFFCANCGVPYQN